MNEYKYWMLSAGSILRNPNDPSIVGFDHLEYYVYRALTAWMREQ